MPASPLWRAAELTRSSLAGSAGLLDGRVLAQAAVGALLGLGGLGVVSMAILVLCWELSQYCLLRFTGDEFLAPFRSWLHPSMADALVIGAAWAVGRIIHALVRRHREARLVARAQAEADAAWQEELLASRKYARTPDPFVESEPHLRPIAPGATQLELDEEEAVILRAAVDQRLAELRRESQRLDQRGFPAELWERIGVLESLLARLPSRARRLSTAS